MSVPKSVVKFKKNEIIYTSSVDYCNYSIQELTNAALRDVGKMVSRFSNNKLAKLKGLSKAGRARGKGSPFQYWLLKKESKLYVGSGTIFAGHFGRGEGRFWYGIGQELGTSNQPKLGILTGTTREHINDIIEIESKYLTGLQNDDPLAGVELATDGAGTE